MIKLSNSCFNHLIPNKLVIQVQHVWKICLKILILIIIKIPWSLITVILNLLMQWAIDEIYNYLFIYDQKENIEYIS